MKSLPTMCVLLLLVLPGLSFSQNTRQTANNGGLVSFTASASGKTVVLDWTTDSEINMIKYTVERSSDAVNFEYVGSISSETGSATAKSYSLTDEHPLGGTSYYRLQQSDQDGFTTYSPVICVYTEQLIDFTVYPNPSTTGTVTVLFPGMEDLTLRITSEKGRLVFTHNYYKEEQQFPLRETTIDADLPPGVYFVSLVTSRGVVTKRLQVLER